MKKMRIGVIGLGGRGRYLAKTFHTALDGSTVTAGADKWDKSRQRFSDEVDKNIPVMSDYRNLIFRKDVDAVIVASSDYLHAEHTVAALQAGKHVFLEKPMGISIKECDRIIRAWKRSGKKLMIGFNMRYMPLFQTMKDIVASGAIGRIRTVWVRHFVGDISGGEGFFHEWFAVRKYANSLLLQKASHDIDMIHWITGTYVRRVAAFGGLSHYGGNKPNDLTCPECKERHTCLENTYKRTEKYLKCAFRREIDVEDNNIVIMEMENGIQASYVQCHFTPNYFRNYVFIGDEGSMENIDDSKVKVLMRRSGAWKDHADRLYEVKPVTGGHGGADPQLCRDFVDYVKDNKVPLTTPECGRMSVAVGCAAAESLRNGGKVVSVPRPTLIQTTQSARGKDL